MTEKIRVVLADDHPIFLAGLSNLIKAHGGLELVGECQSGQCASEMIRTQRPDVAVLDISMPGLNGILLTRRLAVQCPTVKVVILTLHEERSFLHQALDAGARGFVLKRSAAEQLVSAVEAVSRGEIYVDPALGFDGKKDRISQSNQELHSKQPLGLTQREASVLKYTASGLTTKEIAARLALSVKTVETYKMRGAEKLGLKTRSAIVRFAAAQGWLDEI
jgi:DNA-binding NarL/FixJ family response regulator